MTARRDDQRARILDAAELVVFEQGYLNAKIGDIAGRAGVSRATFYELFDSKETCFLTAYDRGAELARDLLARAVAAGRGRYAARAAVTALVELAGEHPHVFVCLTHDATVAGSAALSRRERLLEELGELVAHAQAGDPRGRAPDMPPRVLLGAAARTAGMVIRQGNGDLGPLTERLLAWIELYEVPIRDHGWEDTRLASSPPPAGGEHAPVSPFPAADVPRGRHRLPAAVVRQAQRERILRGTAEAVSAQGYEHTSVADIVTASGVSRDAFYDHMASKRDAVEQATTLFFERSVATFAGAFFAAGGLWAERVWTAGAALGDHLLTASDLTRLALIDAYAPDAQASRRADELLLGLAAFIEHCAAAPDAPLPPGAAAATLAALVEAVLALLATDRVESIPRLLPFATYMVLTPFLGAGPGDAFVQDRLAASVPGLGRARRTD